MKILRFIRCPYPDLMRGGLCEEDIVRGVLGVVRIMAKRQERVDRELISMGCLSRRGIPGVGVGSGPSRRNHTLSCRCDSGSDEEYVSFPSSPPALPIANQHFLPFSDPFTLQSPNLHP
jgi:hypothetical protein